MVFPDSHPLPPRNAASQPGSIATPLALFVLGASLDFSKARANIKLLVISVTGRLVVVPLIS